MKDYHLEWNGTLRHKMAYVAKLANEMKSWENFVIRNCYSCGSNSVDYDADNRGYWYECKRCGLCTNKFDSLAEARAAWQVKQVNWTSIRDFHIITDDLP